MQQRVTLQCVRALSPGSHWMCHALRLCTHNLQVNERSLASDDEGAECLMNAV